MSKIKLRIYTWPEKILKKKCKRVDDVDRRTKKNLEEMLSLMRISGVVGLAANQVGLDLSLVVIEAKDRIFKLVNPCILKKEGTVRFTEGCLSFPGLELEIKRANRVWVSALDENGEEMNLELEGFLAVIFHHEIDHVNGVVFIDRINLWQKIKVFLSTKANLKGRKWNV